MNLKKGEREKRERPFFSLHWRGIRKSHNVAGGSLSIRPQRTGLSGITLLWSFSALSTFTYYIVSDIRSIRVLNIITFFFCFVDFLDRYIGERQEMERGVGQDMLQARLRPGWPVLTTAPQFWYTVLKFTTLTPQPGEAQQASIWKSFVNLQWKWKCYAMWQNNSQIRRYGCFQNHIFSE